MTGGTVLDAAVGGFFEAITPVLLVALGVWAGRVWARMRARRADRIRFAWVMRTDAEFNRWNRNRGPDYRAKRDGLAAFMEGPR